MVFEDCIVAGPQVKHPLCQTGERACRPEDVGGTLGYSHLLEVLANPQHPEYRDLREWVGELSSEQFSAEESTGNMRRGLPD
ncbi:MAG: hypothetical protein NTY19_16810 [Planctomycetota bacterium]|nr:hypothetical protein [Planctomycetota bacterium]